MNYRFIPKRVFFEPDALDYPLGRHLYQYFQQNSIPVSKIASHNRVTGIPGKTPQEGYFEAKNTLVVGIRRTLSFQGCKPSAHYQLPLTTSCPGMCEYCYLQSTLGKKPYLRIYVNLDEILQSAQKYIDQKEFDQTIFEGAATSDPIPTEYLTGALAKSITFFGQQEHARFRFVTKFTDVETLLDIEHNNHTRFRFSLNCDYVINKFEHKTPSMKERVEAAGKVSKAGYPLGFIIAPIIMFDNWEEEYQQLFIALKEVLNPNLKDITLEFISHRFTKKAKDNILSLFPKTELPMNEEERQKKYGQFGYWKYVYPQENMQMLKEFILPLANQYFPESKVEYFV